MSDSYDDYEAQMQLAEHEWEMVKTEHDRAVELGKAYERGWDAALAQRQWVGLTDDEIEDLIYVSQKIDASSSPWFDRLGFAKAIEEALKEKNA